LPEDQATTLLERLDQVMDLEKPWLESELTLPQLAERTGMTPHQLSQLINSRLGMTFFDFVNARRVTEVQRCLADPAYDAQPILEIALAAGFNSKSAFNAAFRQHAGTTPSLYRRAARAPAAT
jgi:transcriptional regulator GlxA family with amidase domain